jgi:DNA-binding transcriptional LysR family regulator
MRRRLPPFEQIEAFVEAARAPSFRVAADRCALSPAAFSRRIQAFSSFFQTNLFERQPGGVRLTEAGEDCLRELEPAYLELRRAAASVARRSAEACHVRLSLSHSLAVGWLIPRLDQVRTAHPQVDLILHTERAAAAVRRGEVDLGICFSDVDAKGLDCELLVPMAAAPMAAPQIARSFRAGAARLEQYRLLTISRMEDPWVTWARESGHDGPLQGTLAFDLMHAAYEAAALGLGVVMGASPTVAPYLEGGRLERLPLPAVRFPGGYNLVATSERSRRPAVAAVRRWLLAEAAATPILA